MKKNTILLCLLLIITYNAYAQSNHHKQSTKKQEQAFFYRVYTEIQNAIQETKAVRTSLDGHDEQSLEMIHHHIPRYTRPKHTSTR